MIMHLTYEFEYNGRVYFGRNVDIGETIDIEHEKEDVEGLKESAVANAFNLSLDGGEEENKLKDVLNNSKFTICELEEQNQQ